VLPDVFFAALAGEGLLALAFFSAGAEFGGEGVFAARAADPRLVSG
jgi:hypothetical protein